MSYLFNSQIDTSRDALNASTPNAPDPSKIFERARTIYQTERQNQPHHTGPAPLDFAWKSLTSRAFGKDAAGMMLLAREALDWALALEAEGKARVQAAADRALAHHCAASAATAAVQNRAAYVSNMAPLFALGSELQAVAADIAAQRGVVGSIENSYVGNSPIGTDEELASYLDGLAAKLATATDALAAMRASRHAA